MTPFPCPHCGQSLPDDAVSCRACGSDHETGWNPDVDYHSVEIPDAWPDEGDPGPGSEISRGEWLFRLVIVVAWFGILSYVQESGFGRSPFGLIAMLLLLLITVESVRPEGRLKRLFFRRR